MASAEELALISLSARLLFANGQTTERTVTAVDQLAEALGFRATVFSTLGRTDRTHRRRYRLTLRDHSRGARGRGHEQGRRDGERDR